MAEERLQWLKKCVDDCKVHACRAGRILYLHQDRRSAGTAAPLEPGAIVRTHQALVELVDAKRLRLEVTLPTALAQRLKTGTKVPVNVDAFPKQSYRGRITNMRVRPPR